MQVGAYTLGKKLGRGATATVYQAPHPASGEPVAVKLYTAQRSLSEGARQRVQLELQTLSRLEHPAIVRLREVGEHEGQLYVVMDLVEGETLQARLDRSGPLGERDALRLVQALAAAIDYAHRCGVLHRDLKPDNVLLAADGPRITDFGLARDLDDDAERLTQTGALLGTPGYLAPEQASGMRELVGKPCDVYGLGGVLYACLTGVPPINARTLPEILAATCQGQVTPPRELRPDLDPPLDALCRACLAREPDARPTAEALARELGGLDLAPARAGRSWASLAAALVLALLALGTTGWALLRSSEPPPQRIAECERLFETEIDSFPPVARRFVADFPESPLGYYYLSVLESEDLNWDRSRTLVERSLDLDPTSARVWRWASTVYGFLDDAEAELHAIERAAELDPVKFLLMCGRIHVKHGELATGEQRMQTLLELDPTHGEGWTTLGIHYQHQERWLEALDAYGRALQFTPPAEHANLFRKRCVTRRALDDFEGALTEIELAAKAADHWPLDYIATRAGLLAKLDRHQESAVAFREAKKLYPTSVAYTFNLHLLEQRLGNHLEARRLLEEAYTLSQGARAGPKLRRLITQAWQEAQDRESPRGR